MGPQRRLRIYVRYETSSIIRYVEHLTGDVFTARFADCHFNESIFPPLGGEKKTHEKDVSWSEPSLLYLVSRTKQSDTEVTSIWRSYQIRWHLIYGCGAPKKVEVVADKDDDTPENVEEHLTMNILDVSVSLGDEKITKEGDCRPMREKGCAIWDRGNSTWGGRERGWVLFLYGGGAQEWLGKRDDFGRERELGVLCGLL
nr:putative RNA-directed DNA polymerase [Tanacetum cinerariifolium]